MALGRAAKREVLKLFALAPVRRGEGKGEGSARQCGAAPWELLWGPLTLALPSPLPGGPGRGDRKSDSALGFLGTM